MASEPGFAQVEVRGGVLQVNKPATTVKLLNPGLRREPHSRGHGDWAPQRKPPSHWKQLLLRTDVGVPSVSVRIGVGTPASLAGRQSTPSLGALD